MLREDLSLDSQRALGIPATAAAKRCPQWLLLHTETWEKYGKTQLGTTYMVQPNSYPSSLEYAENIGDGRSPEFRETEQKRILGLLENF